MIDIKKFDIKKAEKELRKVCRENEIPVTAISIITNNMKIYNSFVDEYQKGDVSIHVLFQISGMIMKHLEKFKQTPFKKPVPKPEPEPEPLEKYELIKLMLEAKDPKEKDFYKKKLEAIRNTEP